MDDRRFDQLVKAVANGASRRSVLKGMLGLGGAALVGSAALDADVDAARRPTPTPKPPSCPGQQTPVGGQCICQAPKAPGPYKCGPDCCTGQVTDPYPRPAGHSECCDNACCFGTCYGEELCCPTNSRGSEGQLPPLAEFCLATNECCLAPDFCCAIDGCCSTVCWGGSFDDDFCCPAEDLCPGGDSSADICCTNNTTCCGAGTNANICVDLSSGGCCFASDCGPLEEGACAWTCDDNACVSVDCTEGTICCQGECVSSSEFSACPVDPEECCSSADGYICCGPSGCCISTRCNEVNGDCCATDEAVCRVEGGCCTPPQECCGGEVCCDPGHCNAAATCCTGSDIACGLGCCSEERCGVIGESGTPACCDVGFIACSGGICCRANIYQCATDGPGCECKDGTEPCGLLPGGCCPDGQCNDSFECCATGTTPCGDVCCDNATQTCNGQGVCLCGTGFVNCGGVCTPGECCGTDTTECVAMGYNAQCVACAGGACVTADLDYEYCVPGPAYCFNGVCLGCFYEEEPCELDIQCCSGTCNLETGLCVRY